MNNRLTRALGFLLMGAIIAPALAFDSLVTVDATLAKATIPATAYGVHTSVYDGRLTHAHVPSRLGAAGVQVLRYPGGGYADVYHWSENRNTQFRTTGDFGYIAPNADFGNFARTAASVPNGQMMITVNYGSSLQGDSGGEPKEAAAWVAYCNGTPSSTQSIGVDSRGNDWRTVGYWASLRAAAPLATDDGKNFLRIGRVASLNCHHWEIGNEVFGNGYFSTAEIENDWHGAYDGSRVGDPLLSPISVGTNVRGFVGEMKAVDPTIKIGVPISTPPHDQGWGPTWDQGLLQSCGDVIDFVSIHDYVGYYAAPNFNTKDPVDVLFKSGPDKIAEIVSTAQSRINLYAGANAPSIRIAVTETSANPLPTGSEFVNALFAANVYAGFLQNGAINVDWLEMHATMITDNEDGTPQPVYRAVQLVNLLMAPGDQAVTTNSSNSLLDTHASRKANGDLGLLLVNTSPTDFAVANITVAGFAPSSSGMLYSLNRDANQFSTTTQNGLGSTFSITVPAYSIRQIIVSPAGAVTPDFGIAAVSASLSLTRGATATSSISISRTSFSNSVDFSATGLPAGVTVSFNPASTSGNTTIATFTASATATTGAATITIAGTNGTSVRSTTITLTVVAASSPPPPSSGGGGGGQFEALSLFLLSALLISKRLANFG